MYYLTVTKGDVELIRRKAFEDYAEAIQFTSQFYQPRSRRSVLVFTTEVINGVLARSYTKLVKPDSISNEEWRFTEKYEAAVKRDNAFDYTDSLFFLVESELGVRDADSNDDESDCV